MHFNCVGVCSRNSGILHFSDATKGSPLFVVEKTILINRIFDSFAVQVREFKFRTEFGPWVISYIRVTVGAKVKRSRMEFYVSPEGEVYISRKKVLVS